MSGDGSSSEESFGEEELSDCESEELFDKVPKYYNLKAIQVSAMFSLLK